jgi:hypothetical protein
MPTFNNNTNIDTNSKAYKDVLNNLYRKHPTLDIRIYGNGKITNLDGTFTYREYGDRAGYLSINHNGHKYSIHRLVAQLWVDNPNPKAYNVVNHLDGNKRNNCFTNLEWCDHAINNEHAIKTGLRTDTIGVKIKNLMSGQVTEFASINRCAKHLGVHTDIIAKKLNGKATPTFKYYVVAKIDEEFPNFTMSQARELNTGFKKPIAYKKVEDKEWVIEPHGANKIAKDITIGETSILRVLNGERSHVKGYMFRHLTNMEYYKCDLVRIDAVSKRTFNNIPKPIIVTNLKDGSVKEYTSSEEFAKLIGVKKKTMQRVRCNSIDGRSYKHYKIDFK